MPALFCPKCKNILIPGEVTKKDFVLLCRLCGYTKKIKGKALVEKEKIPEKKKLGKNISKETNEFADYDSKCKKCGYGKAQIIDMGISYSDEDNLILLKCGKCGWAERVGKKTS